MHPKAGADTIGTRKWGNLVQGGIAILLGIGALGVAGPVILRGEADGALYLAVPVGIALIGYGIWSVRQARDRGPKILIDATGIHDLRARIGPIRWDQMAQVSHHLMPVTRVSVLRIQLKDDAPQVGQGLLGGPFVDIHAAEIAGGMNAILQSVQRHAPGDLPRSGF